MTQAPFALRGHNPDILTSIANLSNDEVFTPPELANAMLDLVAAGWAAANDGADIWADPDVTFLDPFTKSGVFLREITRRLVAGLEPTIPDLTERVDHILTRQVYGIGITRLTSLLARRSVYCSKTANGKHSIATSFDSPEGNIWFERTEHNWQGGRREFRVHPTTGEESVVHTGRRCRYCKAGEDDYGRGEDLETHAYAFIHTNDVRARVGEILGGTMQFDVVIGNPPYQLSDGGGGGGVSATPIYNLFVESAIALDPQHIVMVTPSRWFSGGKGLDSFRDAMLHDRRLAKLVDFPQLYDVFPGVKIRGGVSYWLWTREHDGDCEVVTKIGNEDSGPPVSRRLDAYDVFVRRNEAVRILERVRGYQSADTPEPTLGASVSARNPFGLGSAVGSPNASRVVDPVLVYGNQKTGYLARSHIPVNRSLVDMWKVISVKAHGTSGRDDFTILGRPVIAGPGTACTETYLIIGVCDSEQEARSLASYLRTRFVRFLVSLRKISHNITRDTYQFVPALPLDRTWDDAQLYERYKLTLDEIAFIESQVTEQSEMVLGDETSR